VNWIDSISEDGVEGRGLETVRPGVAGLLPRGVRSVALPTAGVRPVVSAAKFKVEGMSDPENLTRFEARRFVGVIIEAPVSNAGLTGEITLARRLLRRAVGAIVSLPGIEAMSRGEKALGGGREKGREIRGLSISCFPSCCEVKFRTG
jgi:hypothetical protein